MRRVFEGGIYFFVIAFLAAAFFEGGVYLRVRLIEEIKTNCKLIDASMPQNRQHRLKDHRLLQDMAIHDPDSDDIFEKGLLDTHYPKRPASLEEVCLYDFVAKYDWQS